MIDLHCHILPGVDDGPTTLHESLQLARFSVADGITVITATHDLSILEDIADRCIVLENGHVAGDGTPHEILHDWDLLQRAHLVHIHRHRHGSGEIHAHPHVHGAHDHPHRLL